jgi:hypothetical protein
MEWQVWLIKVVTQKLQLRVHEEVSNIPPLKLQVRALSSKDSRVEQAFDFEMLHRGILFEMDQRYKVGNLIDPPKSCSFLIETALSGINHRMGFSQHPRHSFEEDDLEGMNC